MTTVVLDPRSIIEALSCVQSGITAEDITHPAANRVQSIYNAFCSHILEVPEKCLSELPFGCQLNPETLELQHKSTPLLLLFTTMRCFITDFGDGELDFTMCDLINPSPRRTRRLFSTASQVFEKTCAEYDDARKAIEDGQEQIRREEMRKAALRSEQDARKRKENALLAEYNSKNTVLTELIKQSQANEARRDALLASIKSTKEEKKSLLVEIKSLQNEIEHLTKGIVNSPERVRGEANFQREEIKRLQNNCKEESQRISNNAESMSIIEQAAKVLNERFHELEKFGDLKTQIQLLEQDASQAKATLIEATRSRQQTCEELSKLAASGSEEVKKYERARELYRTRLVDLKTKKEELNDAIIALKGNDPCVRGEMVQIRNEMQRLGKERADENKYARMQCLELLSRFADLVEKYQRAEKLFDSQTAAFMEVIHELNDVLEEGEQSIEQSVQKHLDLL
ncbi:unnamed protein product [Cylicocyclus nassatus]|uniref:Kinetochore protein Nuf2 N-terminal domain-containing protein n=1 Tax=Cylicocyclus nassatus TaxID=53992 RepID=A0AA36M7N3_CYLNA|nr:unnamed protein product [Cylicocyclus nassatus]